MKIRAVKDIITKHFQYKIELLFAKIYKFIETNANHDKIVALSLKYILNLIDFLPFNIKNICIQLKMILCLKFG
jgi:hypothetical protein